ncbi:basic membrane protein A and related proteins [Candidatus Magnetomoraceae bacterium gMMP-15]
MNCIYRGLWVWLFFIVIINCYLLSYHNEAAAEKNPFKVALLLPRVINADGWTRGGYKGLLLIKEKLGAEIAYSENVPEDDFERVFRKYAQDGFDFIIGHGGQFVPAAEIVAEEFPRTKFAVMAKYAGNNKNLGALSMRESEKGYLAGVVAALKTKTNKVAYIGGLSHSAGQAAANFFKHGVQTTNPKVFVEVSWVEGYTDQKRAVQLAQARIRAGFDVLLVNAGEAGLAVHPVAEQAGIYTIGWIDDQYELAPKAVITSLLQNLFVLLVRGAELVHAGRWEGRQYRFGLREGVQFLAPFRGMLTPAQEMHVLSVQKNIIRGKIDLMPLTIH